MNNVLLSSEDHALLSLYLHAPNQSATANQVMRALTYPSIGAVNLHVVRLAKKLSTYFGYQPTVRPNGNLKWCPCLFNGYKSPEGFVWTLKEEIQTWYRDGYHLDVFYVQVQNSIQDSEQRRARLNQSNPRPQKKLVSTWEFVRNPDVVAEVLVHANGFCQACGSAAPFNRKSDGSPYLEVHHRVQLAAGGEDTVANAIALCPNCHRKSHYG